MCITGQSETREIIAAATAYIPCVRRVSALLGGSDEVIYNDRVCVWGGRVLTHMNACLISVEREGEKTVKDDNDGMNKITCVNLLALTIIK